MLPLPCSRTKEFLSPLYVVEANAIHRDEPPERRITSLSFLCKPPIQRADATAATTTPAAIGCAFINEVGGVSARAFGFENTAEGLVWGAYPRIGDVAPRYNRECNLSFRDECERGQRASSIRGNEAADVEIYDDKGASSSPEVEKGHSSGGRLQVKDNFENVKSPAAAGPRLRPGDTSSARQFPLQISYPDASIGCINNLAVLGFPLHAPNLRKLLARKLIVVRAHESGFRNLGWNRGEKTSEMQQRWPSRLWVVRHGQSAGNVARDAADAAGLARIDIPHRDVDVPLSELGEQQSAALGRWFSSQAEAVRPDVVMTSPYLRAQVTGELIRKQGGVSLAKTKRSS